MNPWFAQGVCLLLPPWRRLLLVFVTTLPPGVSAGDGGLHELSHDLDDAPGASGQSDSADCRGERPGGHGPAEPAARRGLGRGRELDTFAGGSAVTEVGLLPSVCPQDWTSGRELFSAHKSRASQPGRWSFPEGRGDLMCVAHITRKSPTEEGKLSCWGLLSPQGLQPLRGCVVCFPASCHGSSWQVCLAQ